MDVYTLNKLGPIFDKAIVQERLELSALIGATFGAMTSGDALSGASIATSGTKDNYLRTDVLPMRAEIIGWESVYGREMTDKIVHGAVRYVYADGSSVEVHYGKYTGEEKPWGDGTGFDTKMSKKYLVIYKPILRKFYAANQVVNIVKEIEGDKTCIKNY